MPFLDKHVMIMSEIMTPEKANFSGNIHGGHILSAFGVSKFAILQILSNPLLGFKFFVCTIKKPPVGGFFMVAEREGFEPSVRDDRTHTFQACSFDHSDTSPRIEQGSVN